MENVVLITGGSGGIGTALAKRFARSNFNLLLIARDPVKLETAKRAALLANPAIQVVTLSKDLLSTNAAEDIYGYCRENNLQVEILCNNAGVGTYGAFADSFVEDNENIIQIDIVNMTGFPSKPEEKKKYGISHMYFETILDYLLGHEKGTFTRPDVYLEMPKEDAEKIGAMWDEMNKMTLSKEHFDSKSFVYSLKDYKTALHSAFSKHGKKKALFKKIFGSESHAWAMSYPQNLDDLKDIDFLNKSHTEWFDPVSGISHKESFYDLMFFGSKARKMSSTIRK